MATADINGLQMSYEVHGTGTPLVLISPLSGDRTTWALQVPAFVEAGYRCLIFDSRDAGQTTESPIPGYTVRQLAEDTVALMDVVGFGPAHLLGISMGGMIAQEIAAAFPSRAASLTLCATVAATDDTMAAVIRGWKLVRPQCSSEEFLRLISPWLFTHRFFAEPDGLAFVLQLTRDAPFPQTPAAFARQCEAILSHDMRARLPTIAAPTLVLVGEEDVLTPPRHSREIAALIPGATLTILPGAGHAASGEFPPVFNETVIGFLNGIERATS